MVTHALGVHPRKGKPMLPTSLLNVVALSGMCLGGCRDTDPTGPARELAPASLLVGSDSLCARVSFKITSPTAVQTTFPNRTTCPSGLVVIRGPAATWSQSQNRRLRLFVRILNKSGQTIQLPVRLYLPSNGTTVITPAGTSPSKVVAITPDSSEAGGGRIWFIGGTATLAANDSTILDTLTFNVKSPVTEARFQFQATASSVDTVRPPIPDVTSVPDDSTHVITDPNNPSLIYYRTYVHVLFTSAASGTQIQGLITKYGATVVGGIPWLGEYTLQVPDPGPSWTQTQNLVASIRAEPGVQSAGLARRIGSIPTVDGRYPVDGLGHGRSEWFVPTSQHVWAFQAIRAPMAWGCETAQYGTSKARVGVLEFDFDSLNLDLLPLHPTAVLASVDPGVPPIPQTARDQLVWHGTASSVLLSGQGDDGVGMAGVVWSSSLKLYGMNPGNASARAQAMRKLASELIPAMIADKPDVVSSQVRLGDITDSVAIEDVAEALKRLFTESPKTLWIQTIGDDHFDLTEAQLYTSGLPQLGLRAALLKAWSAGFQGNILFVAGNDANHNFSAAPVDQLGAGSSFIRQRTQIAAPGVAVEVPAPIGSGLPFTWEYGTSAANPLVAGVAAQLRTMDSTLSAAELKSYILRGAQKLRINPSTGASEPPVPLGLAPETIYQLDAYGSLSLLSKERSGTPICGIEVSYEPTSDFLAGQVILGRNLPQTGSVPAPPSRGPLAVAQGGRLYALTWWNSTLLQDETREYVLQGGQWVVRRTMAPQFARLYLEKDTVDWPHQFQPIILRGSQWGAQGTSADLATIIQSQDPDFIDLDWWVQVSSDAKYAVVRSHDASQTCSFGAVRVWMVTLPSGPAQSLEGPTCRESSGRDRDAAWDPTGRHVIIGVQGITAIYQAWTISNGVATADGQPVAVFGRELGPYFVQHTTDPSGGTVLWAEGDASGSCFVTTRQASGSFTTIAERANPMCVLPVKTLRAPGAVVAQSARSPAVTDTAVRRLLGGRATSGGSRW